MKKFLIAVAAWKTSASLLFTGEVVIYLFFNFGITDVSAAVLWGLLLASVAGSLFQTVCYTNWIIKKMRNIWRHLLFVLLFLPTLSFIAWKAEWFPMDQAGEWAIFIVIFFVIFFISAIGFDIYFRITGKKYDGIIGRYRMEKEAEEKDGLK